MSMNLAKISENGQIIVPIDKKVIRFCSGDKILFVQKDNREIVINNTSVQVKYGCA